MNDDGQKRKTKDQDQIDWTRISRVLIVRLRSIGDTVLATPSLIALKRFLPNAEIDILLEDWVAPVLDGFDSVDNVLTVGKGFVGRMGTALEIRRRKYDVVFNLHGGSTSTFLTYATGAKHRIGYKDYRYSFLYTDRLSSSSDFWKKEFTHSAEQQLALLGSVGVPVDDRPKSRLAVSNERADEAESFLHVYGVDEERIALIHPASVFVTKQWAPENFAKTIDFLASIGLSSVVVTGPNEKHPVEEINNLTKTMFHGFWDLTLPEVTALAKRAELFVGNDSGIAHIAAAVDTPTVVIFGSSNRNHWYPWTDSPNEMVFNEFHCQPCPGYECKEFGDPKCIKSVSVAQVIAAIERVLEKKKDEPTGSPFGR